MTFGAPENRIRFVYDFRRFHGNDFGAPSKSYTIRIRFSTISCGTILGYPQNRIRFVYDFRRFHWHDFRGTLKIVYDSYTIFDDFMWHDFGGCRKSYTISYDLISNRVRFSGGHPKIVYDFVRFDFKSCTILGRGTQNRIRFRTISFQIVYDFTKCFKKSYTISYDFVMKSDCPYNPTS